MAMSIERRQITNRDEWLRWRKDYIGASQIGAIFNAHPFLSPLKLHLMKRGIEFSEKETGAMRRGRLLEPAVGLAVAEERPEWTIRPAKEFYFDQERRIAATPDFFIEGDPRGLGILQAKSAAPGVYQRDWGNGTEVPFWITLQALTEMMLTDAAFGAIAVLCVDPFDLVCSIHEINRHPAGEAKIIAAVRQFWDDVEHGREPGPDYGKDTAIISILAPRESSPDKTVDLSANNELPELLAERELLCARIHQDETRCKEIETQIKFMMRDAAVVTGLPDWRITWKTEPRTGYTVKPSEPRVLRIYDRRREEAA
jgi:predicted phage-related endonuclease